MFISKSHNSTKNGGDKSNRHYGDEHGSIQDQVGRESPSQLSATLAAYQGSLDKSSLSSSADRGAFAMVTNGAGMKVISTWIRLQWDPGVADTQVSVRYESDISSNLLLPRQARWLSSLLHALLPYGFQ